MNKTFYITTPIYYTSNNLHIGHAYTTVISDAIARYKKLRGYDVYFLTGTDEHGEKIQSSAAKAGKEPQLFVDEIVEKIQALWKRLDIQYDDFIRTTQPRHKEVVQKIFTQLLNQGDIYKGVYEGMYCTPCESFWTKSQLNEDGTCPDCGRPVHEANEEAYFFKMSKYADRLVQYYNDHPGFIEPESRKNEMLQNFILPGLEDLCVSRTSFSWGIPVKEDPRHVVYVWIDALSNYITALGYQSASPELYNKFWHNNADHEVLHIVGKEIVRFHVIYWPIMLMALGIDLPTKIFGHGWITMKDGKMSKSKGNVVEPIALMDRYGLDALRYFVTHTIIFGQDGLFTPELFIDNINANLVNNYGNLLSRTTSMITKFAGGIVPAYQGIVGPFDTDLEQGLAIAVDTYEREMDAFHPHFALDGVFDYLDKANKYIENTAPWALAKDPAKKAELDSVLCHLAESIRQATILLQIVLLKAPGQVKIQLGLSDAQLDYSTVRQFGISSGNSVTKGDNLYPRLDATIEVEYIAASMQGK